MRARALLFAILIITSVVAPVTALASAPAAAQDGMVGVPSSNVNDELPDYALNAGLSASPFEDSVQASSHPESLTVDVTTEAALEGRTDACLSLDAPQWCDDSDVALVLTDEDNHEGRHVAVPKSEVVDSLGRVPEVAYVEHSSGDTYQVPVTEKGNQLVFEVREFSSNTVTFDGEISVQGNPATDGAQYQYDITDVDSVDNYTIDVTGSTVRDWQTTTGASISDGGSLTVDVDGNTAPSSANVTLKGRLDTQAASQVWSDSTAANSGVGAGRAGDLVIATDDNAYNHVYNVETGNKKASDTWAGMTLHDAASGDPGTFYTVNYANGLYANDSSTLSGEWHHYPNSDWNPVSVAYDPQTDLVFTGDDNLHEARGHSAADGSNQWTLSSPFSGDVTAAGADDGVVAFGDQNGNLALVDASMGSTEWTTTHDAGINDVAVGAEVVVVVDNADRITAYERSDGSERWSAHPNNGVAEGVMVDSEANRAYAAMANDYRAYKLDASGTASAVWTETLTPSPSAVAGTTQYIFGVNDDGTWDGYEVASQTSDPSVTIDGETVSYSGDMADGETYTETISPSVGSHSASVSLSSGNLDLEVNVEETTVTENPTVEVNGQTTSYSGTLSDGQTASLSTNTTWVETGTNRINISATNPGGSAPTPQVGLDYSHGAADDVSVQYDGETWSERYNISHTYASDRSNSTLRIPFSSDRVVAVRDAEYRVNGGSWSSIPESDRDFDGSELILQLGDVSAGDEVEIRANGSKVRVPTGEITVLEPTTEGNSLQTKIELTSWSSDAYIDVSGTSSKRYVHHAANESWSSPDEYAYIDGGDEQHLYMPKASSGATARVETIPLDVDTNGDVEVGVRSGGFEPELSVGSGTSDGDTVTWNWEHPDLTTGTTYILYSLSGDKLIDEDEAQSPVTFESGDGSQTLQIQEETDDGGSTGSTDGGIAAPVGVSGAGPLNSVPVIVIAWVAVVGGLFVVNRRISGPSGITIPVVGRTIPAPGGALTWVGAIGSGIFILEFIAEGDPISSGIATIFESGGTIIEQIGPFAGIVVTLLAAWYAYRRFIKGRDNTIVVRGEG
jgi:hypothetical protein